MENRAHALAAGLFVMLLGVASVLALLWLGDEDSDNSREVLVATTRNVGGLSVASKVLYRGIRAGQVESIGPDTQDPRILLMRISLDRQYPVTTHTVAKLGYQGLTGLAYVQLEDDGSSAELLEGQSGELPRIAMQPSLLETLSEKSGDITTQVSELVGRMLVLLDDKNTQNLSRAIDNIALGSDGLREMPRLMAAIAEVLSTQNLERISALLANLEKATGDVEPLVAELRKMVKAVTSLSEQVDQVAGAAGAETMPRVNALLRDLDTNTHQLSRVLELIDKSPQALLFGRRAAQPGPGETGFGASAKRGAGWKPE